MSVPSEPVPAGVRALPGTGLGGEVDAPALPGTAACERVPTDHAARGLVLGLGPLLRAPLALPGDPAGLGRLDHSKPCLRSRLSAFFRPRPSDGVDGKITRDPLGFVNRRWLPAVCSTVQPWSVARRMIWRSWSLRTLGRSATAAAVSPLLRRTPPVLRAVLRIRGGHQASFRGSQSPPGSVLVHRPGARRGLGCTASTRARGRSR